MVAIPIPTARRATDELKPGAVVGTYGHGTVTGFVHRIHPPQAVYTWHGITWRTVEDIAVQPADRKVDPDRIVFFTDGMKAETRSTYLWLVRAPQEG